MGGSAIDSVGRTLPASHLVLRPCTPACLVRCHASGRGRQAAVERPLPPRDAIDFQLTDKEARRKVSKAVQLVRMHADLIPEDRTFNFALALWKAVQEIPSARRVELLDRLSSQDMALLWQIAGQRYGASTQDTQNTLGPGYSVWDEFPTQPELVATWEGKAALPALNRFQKRFFLHPTTLELYGFVDVGSGWLGRRLFPLYFKCNVDQLLYPDTVDLTDMQLEYLPLDRLGLPAELVPKGAGLPAPRDPRWPFSPGLTDYMRPVGPGVFVGRGWSPAEGSSDPSKGASFLHGLHFVLVKGQA